MVRNYLKGFRKDKDPLGIKHSMNARGLGGYASRPSFSTKFSKSEVSKLAPMVVASRPPEEVPVSQMSIEPISPIPEVTPIPQETTPSRFTPEKVSIAQPKTEELDSSSSFSIIPTIGEVGAIVEPPPMPPKIGDL